NARRGPELLDLARTAERERNHPLGSGNQVHGEFDLALHSFVPPGPQGPLGLERRHRAEGLALFVSLFDRAPLELEEAYPAEDLWLVERFEQTFGLHEGAFAPAAFAPPPRRHHAELPP